MVEACKLDPKSRDIREAYASIREAEKEAKKADVGYRDADSTPGGRLLSLIDHTLTH